MPVLSSANHPLMSLFPILLRQNLGASRESDIQEKKDITFDTVVEVAVHTRLYKLFR
jgi:hypothetical protein